MLAGKAASGIAGICHVGFVFSVIPNGKITHARIFYLLYSYCLLKADGQCSFSVRPSGFVPQTGLSESPGKM